MTRRFCGFFSVRKKFLGSPHARHSPASSLRPTAKQSTTATLPANLPDRPTRPCLWHCVLRISYIFPDPRIKSHHCFCTTKATSGAPSAAPPRAARRHGGIAFQAARCRPQLCKNLVALADHDLNSVTLFTPQLASNYDFIRLATFEALAWPRSPAAGAT